ncbi:CLUMA_CG001859, isoform A [Clunio marinus]|uniref:CLUMA_CG001859, isoform A n=1 Tax=Clunio marinus TaxID=568069 RepID=A0A1J1HKL8_9DIPT|nr:CLUMA_CG001859, isoform A [Clunio marinus]
MKSTFFRSFDLSGCFHSSNSFWQQHQQQKNNELFELQLKLTIIITFKVTRNIVRHSRHLRSNESVENILGLLI